MKPKVSIIIVNYNVKQLLLTCLHTVFSDVPEAQVIVVDNNSSDGSVQSVKEQFPMVHLIANNYNAGFPLANNQGIALAKADHILLLNPDTEVMSTAISSWLHYLSENASIRISAPKLFNTDGSVQYSILPFISVSEIWAEVFFLHTWMKRKNSYLKNEINQAITVEAASGAALMIHRSVFDEIGLLDTDMFWTEDMEFCYRASLYRIQTFYLPQFHIVHHVGQSGKKNLNVMISNQVLTKINFFKKNHSFFALFLVVVARLLHIISRILLFGILAIANETYRAKCKAYIFTMSRFIKNEY